MAAARTVSPCPRYTPGMTPGEKFDAFLGGLTRREDVLAVILFGSRARGDARPDSDFDLIVILRDGFARTVEWFEGQAFEIVWVTESGARRFWDENPDDAVALWQVANVLFDRDGTGERLRAFGADICAREPTPIALAALAQLRFDADDTLRAVGEISRTDPTTAALLLHGVVDRLTGTFFRLRGAWVPPPKQRIAAVRAMDGEFAALLDGFFAAHGLNAKVALVRLAVDRVIARTPGLRG